jgi:molecular chaperone IbpA
MTKQLMEWPFGRHAIGFNDLFDNLQSTANMSTYPPYNIWQVDPTTYRIEIALAGFTKKDLSITHDKNLLSITGEVTLVEGDTSDEIVLHKGISNKRFERSFTLGEHIQVESAKMKNGMLVIVCKEIIPEELQPKLIDIS